MNESYPHAGWDPLGLRMWLAGVLAVEASRSTRERFRSDARTHQLSGPTPLRATDEDHPSLALCYSVNTFGARTKSSFCDCKYPDDVSTSSKPSRAYPVHAHLVCVSSGQRVLSFKAQAWDSPAALFDPCIVAFPGEPVRVVPCAFSQTERRRGDVPGFRMESPMIAKRVNAPKGPALLAKAGVTFSDAQWLYAQRATASEKSYANDPRFVAIKQKVSAFLSQQIEVGSAELAFA